SIAPTFLEPGIVGQPTYCVPTRMGQREIFREKVTPTCDGLGHRAPPRRGQVVMDGVAADEQNQPDSRKGRAQRRVPAWRTFAARRQVRAPGVAAGIAHTDRYDRDAAFAVGHFAIESEPFAQPVAAA